MSTYEEQKKAKPSIEEIIAAQDLRLQRRQNATLRQIMSRRFSFVL